MMGRLALLCLGLCWVVACRAPEPAPPAGQAETAPEVAPQGGVAEAGEAQPALPPDFPRRWDTRREIIDSHVHLAPSTIAIALALDVFAAAGIGRFAVKSAGAPGSLRYASTLAMQRILGDRMRAFSNIEWRRFNDEDFVAAVLGELAQAKADGMVGIKIFKDLGLGVRRLDGSLVSPDDPVLAPIFAACGRLGLIVAWHIADPVAFFEPVTPENERYDELSIAASWSFHGEDFPTFAALMAVQERVIASHPENTFLLIHMGNYAENLDYVDHLLSTYPRVYVDVSARVPEIGRHPPEQVRAFFIKHQDRILFGSDIIFGAEGAMQLGSVSAREPGFDDAVVFYQRHWHYFETDHRQIAHPTPIQGRWRIDAVDLPLEILEKFYVDNAARLIWGQSGEGAP